MPEPLNVAVVIVTYNSAEVLEGCLRVLPSASAGVRLTEVVVVDNASTDETVRVAKEFGDFGVTIVQLGRNAGYAAGFNAGCAALAGTALDAVLLINPDCRLRPGALSALAAALSVPGRGIVAPKLINPDGSLQPTLRRMPTVWRAVAEAVVGGKRYGELIFDEDAHERAGRVPWATGAAVLISWAALAEVGPFDESFLLYSEETEFMLRAADRGWSVWYEPAAVVEHIGGDSGVNPALYALMVSNKVSLFRRRRGFFAGGAYHAAVLFGESIRALAGRRVSRAAVAALVRPSRRISSLEELG